jgi:hypothetical protein
MHPLYFCLGLCTHYLIQVYAPVVFLGLYTHYFCLGFKCLLFPGVYAPVISFRVRARYLLFGFIYPLSSFWVTHQSLVVQLIHLDLILFTHSLISSGQVYEPAKFCTPVKFCCSVYHIAASACDTLCGLCSHFLIPGTFTYYCIAIHSHTTSNIMYSFRAVYSPVCFFIPFTAGSAWPPPP